ncbi:Bromodomain transcription factor [Macleaya cordata]|uniref:Transcription initiation factor TFIID subunit 8 n=1 Tax=Macleaya cordata TaxID=56857 RepID=A0A200PRJ6_MACCD|nr:Bromodomain transcription factor [Macleaya cordata]
MSDGGRENGRENENDTRKNKQPGGDDFGRAIARIAVAQICETTGFESFNESALDALSDIVIRYLRDLGKTANFYANLAGRMDCNVFDIIQGLEDLGFSQGFPSASDVNHCLADSGTVRELTHYVNLAEEIPFARTVPRFPITRNRKSTPSFLQIGETPAGKHIPAWLPAFPDPHTYIHTPVWNERATDLKTDKVEQARQRRKAERSLLSLQQRLAYSGSAIPVSVDPRDSEKAKQVTESNPFLAPPIEFSEKEVSVPVLPSKLLIESAVENQISVLETFAPVIEAAKSGFSDLGDGERKVLPNKRPIVHFKFGVGKKSLGMPVDLSLQNKGVGRTYVWFGRDEEKDDKKRRAEQILKESMENQQDLAQL